MIDEYHIPGRALASENAPPMETDGDRGDQGSPRTSEGSEESPSRSLRDIAHRIAHGAGD
jgi:hypothetical protein